MNTKENTSQSFGLKKLILVRHGQSEWNKENRFTGWTDIPLSVEGREEAIHAGKLLKKHNMFFECAFSSVLKRSIHTLWLILKEMDLEWLPVYKAWELNERHYGALQGKNKSDIKKQYGEKQFKLWRRSYTTCPPLLDESENISWQDQNINPYKNTKVPRGESLEDTLKRVLPYWENSIKPCLKKYDTVLISAHGNSLRALIKQLENLSDTEIVNLEIPTGKTKVYDLDAHLNVSRSYFLETI